SSFEELASSDVTIDGKPAVITFYRGTAGKDNNLPIEFVSAIIQSGHTYTKVTAWCVEPLFHDVQPAFEKLLKSYRATGQTTASAPRPYSKRFFDPAPAISCAGFFLSTTASRYNLPPMPTKRTHPRGLMLIAAFKLLKGLALFAVGIAVQVLAR